MADGDGRPLEGGERRREAVLGEEDVADLVATGRCAAEWRVEGGLANRLDVAACSRRVQWRVVAQLWISTDRARWCVRADTGTSKPGQGVYARLGTSPYVASADDGRCATPTYLSRRRDRTLIGSELRCGCWWLSRRCESAGPCLRDASIRVSDLEALVCAAHSVEADPLHPRGWRECAMRLNNDAQHCQCAYNRRESMIMPASDCAPMLTAFRALCRRSSTTCRPPGMMDTLTSGSSVAPAMAIRRGPEGGDTLFRLRRSASEGAATDARKGVFTELHASLNMQSSAQGLHNTTSVRTAIRATVCRSALSMEQL